MTPPVEPLPRDLVIDGHSFTQVYRQKNAGGAVVYLKNSAAGVATGHEFHVFNIAVIDGKETIGETLAIRKNCDAAMSIAGQAP